MQRTFLGRLVSGSEGSVAAIVALAIMALGGMLSLAVDLGHLYTVRNELQNTADAAALAAVGKLIKEEGGVVTRDFAGAQEAAMQVAQRQAALQGMDYIPVEGRTDVTTTFGTWNINAASPDQAWTAGQTQNANGVEVTIKREAGSAYGPVTNFFAGLFGTSHRLSTVEAKATAYLGYTQSVMVGTVQLPLAIPESALASLRDRNKSWFARVFGPKEATAVSYESLTFKDLGSGTFYQSNLSKPQLDASKAYLVVVNSSDLVPSTVINNIKKTYTSGTLVRAMERGTQLYPLSEYQWASNINSIFSALKSAYNAKKDGNGRWRVSVPVYSTTNPMASRFTDGLIRLVRLLSPGPPEAQACFKFWTQTYPGGNVPIYVDGFTVVDVVNVTYNSGCDDCSPYSPAANGVRYASTVDCMVNNPNSCRNANSITIEVPIDASTQLPPGSNGGGPSNQGINSSAPNTVGAFSTIPKLVK